MEARLDLFNKAGEASKKAGIQFAYHNHSFEFDPAASLGGKLPYDFSLPSSIPSSWPWNWISAGSASPARIPLPISKNIPAVPARSRQGLITGRIHTEYLQGAMASPLNSAAAWPTSVRAPWIGSASSGSPASRHQTYFRRERRAQIRLDDIKISYDYLRALRF